MFLETRFHAFAEERSVRQHYSGPTIGFQDADNESQKKICRFASLEVLGEIAFDAVFLTPAKRRIREYDIDAVGRGVADIGTGQCVVVAHEARILYAVQEHV